MEIVYKIEFEFRERYGPDTVERLEFYDNMKAVRRRVVTTEKFLMCFLPIKLWMLGKTLYLFYAYTSSRRTIWMNV